MKNSFWKSVYAFVWGCGIVALCYFGWFRGIEWASNIAQFVLWITALLSIFIGCIYLLAVGVDEDTIRKTAKPVPLPSRWVTHPFSVLEVGLCVASGHWVLGLFVLADIFAIACVRNVSVELLKPKSEPTAEH